MFVNNLLLLFLDLCSFRITSPPNSGVVKAVSTAIGDEYDLSVVKGNVSFRKMMSCILQLSFF